MEYFNMVNFNAAAFCVKKCAPVTSHARDKTQYRCET